LSESILAEAPVYRMGGLKGQEDSVDEAAWVQFAWNSEGLYVGIRCADSFIVQQNRQDEQLHYLSGDVFELFIRPLNDSYYWENYVTPFGNKSTLFFFKSVGGKQLTDALTGHDFRQLVAGAQRDVEFEVDGQSYRGWTAEMWIPNTYMTSFEEVWGEEGEWTVHCGRYNYGEDFPEEPELSMYPPLSELSFHLAEEYARLKLRAPNPSAT